MGVRLEDGVGCGGDGHGNEMHTDGAFGSFGSALMKMKDKLLPSKETKERNAAAKEGAAAGVAVHDAGVVQGKLKTKFEEMKKLAAEKEEKLKIAYAADERLRKLSSGV